MTKRSAPVEVVSFIRGLRREHGGFAATPEGAANLRPTLSALKVLEHLGALSSEPRTADFIVAARHVSGGFGSAPGADPTPLDTAAGLISLHALGRSDLLEKLLPDALTYLAAASASQFDHFMQIATYQECQVAHPTPAGSIAFFQDRLGAAIAADKIIDLAIAGSALMRAGQALPIRDDVARRLLAGQGPVEGGFGEGEHASLFGTYCVMRHLALLNVPPDTRRLLAYIDSLRTDWGYADAPGGATSADATYQCLEILAWLGGLQRGAVEMARAGDRAGLLSWLENGGDPDLTDDEGWTPLLAAASHGRADAVDLLLNHNIPGVPRADPAKRFEPADALPLYMAGHAGDLRTVQLLLQAAPEHLHAISSVNGHTVLLQAAFYGKQRHLELAAWLLDNAAQIAGKPKADLVDEQVQLLSATNVRGYSALGMQDL